MSYQRPQDPYIHSNASQYDERYQQSYQQGGYQQQGYAGAPAAGYHDYPDHASGYQGSAYKESQEGLYGGQQAGGYGQQRNAATQAAATYSYAKPKRGVSKWVKFGIPILILVIAGAVVGGIFGSRAANDNKSSSGSGTGSGSVGSGSTPNVQGAALTAAQQAAKNGGNNMLFYQGTDPYGNPSYVSANVDTSEAAYNGQAHNSTCSDSWTPTNSLTDVRPHPRIMTTQAEWDCLPNKIANDAYLTVWNSTIFTNATAWASEPPVAYIADGGFAGSGILDVSRAIQERVKAWAYAYKISNNSAFKDRLYLELNNAAGNTDTFFGQNGTHWNPIHFLDVAEMTSAFAMAYDWLYNDWNSTERDMIRNAIVDYGLVPGQAQYSTSAGWWTMPVNGDGNWNCVCNGGLLTGALAIRGDGTNATQTTIADSIINSALTNMKANCMRGVYDDGTWTETANYWYFGTNAHGRALSTLLTATGTDQDLMAQNPNWYKTSEFHMYVSGPAGLFAYGDNGPNKFATTANQLMLYSRLTGDARAAVYQRDRADASFDPLSMFWYEPTAKGAYWNGLALDRFFNDARGQWASMRSSWTDPSAVFVGMKASNLTGHQTHGDLDAGDFIIDALGTRWAGEYGSGNYLSTGYFSTEDQNSDRWTYYRKATDGQNTLIINNENQRVATCLPVNSFASTNVSQTGDLSFKPAATDAVQFISDLSSCYGQTAGTVQRGIRLLNGRRQVLVQDEIAQASNISSIQWRVQTNGTVSISSDGKTATLTQSSITDPNAGVVGKVSLGGTKTMKVQILSPSNATFASQGPPAQRIYGTATYSAPPEVSDQVNVGVTALYIDLASAQSGAQTLQVLWQPQWDSLSAADQATPKSVPLSQWSLTSHN